MKPAHRALIDYWIGIGKVRRVRSNPNDPASRWRYLFIRNDGIQLELKHSWRDFFRFFNSWNLYAFSKELIPYIEEDAEPVFDPWNDVGFIAMEIPFDGKTLTYRCVAEIK